VLGQGGLLDKYNLPVSERGLIALLSVITMLAPFSIDAYLPAFPQLVIDLGAPISQIQMTLAAFILGFALGPLITGPISDAVGRHPVILLGLVGFGVFSVACAVASNVEHMIAFRFCQAMAGSASLVAARALLADVYRGDALAQKNSVINMFLAIAPMVAPLIGGWLSETWDWRMIFWVMGLATCFALLASVAKMPETLPPEKREQLNLAAAFKGYRAVLGNRIAMTYACATAGVMAVFFTYIAATPFLYMQTYGLSVSTYSILFGAGAILAMIANYMNIFAVKRLGFRPVLLVQGMMVIGLGVIAFGGAFGLFGRWAIYFSGLMFMPMLHVIGANALTGAMDQFDRNKGIASAFFVAVRFGMGVLAIAIVGAVGGEVEIRYGLILFVFAAFSGIAAQMAVRWDRG